MTVQIALLRAVNLGAHNRVAMADLRAMLRDLGFTGVQTLLQSGNAVFKSAGPSGAELEALLEREAAERLGLKTPFRVRTASQWEQLIAANPFPAEAKDDPSHLLVIFLERAPEREAVAALQAAIKGREVVRAHGREAYVVFPDGVGRSKLSPAMFGKAFGAGGTARNWNTVLKLAALATA